MLLIYMSALIQIAVIYHATKCTGAVCFRPAGANAFQCVYKTQY